MKQFLTRRESGRLVTSPQLDQATYREQTSGLSDSPAKTYQSQESNLDSEETEVAYSSLFLTSSGGATEDSRPEWLIAENVMGFFSSNRGYDFLAAQVALDEIGYDTEWEVFNATQFGIPQNRQRVFLVGHSRRHGRREVFPLRVDAAEIVKSDAAPVLTPDRVEKRQNGRRFKEPGEPMFTLTAQDRHGVLVSYNRKDGIGDELDTALTLNASDWRGLNRNQTQNAVIVDTKMAGEPRYYCDNAPTLQANAFKEPLKVMTKTRIRKLTPLECWRLMGRTDDEFYAAKNAGVSDTQLYKQAGNSLIPQIVQAIGERIAVLSESSVEAVALT